MKICIISDTHEQQDKLVLPQADLLIFCGDITYTGDRIKTLEFVDWFDSQPHKHKIFIAGNHDFLYEDSIFPYDSPFRKNYLYNQAISIDGYIIYASPYTPKFGNWAFMKKRGDEIANEWKKIPQDTDILITHGPPQGILDKTRRGVNAGCYDLMKRVKEIKPQLHAFGHIHEGYGQVEKDGTIFVNASNCDEFYNIKNPPIVVEI